jgi:serine/threonine protein kinase
VTHNDIKPDNVIISLSDTEGHDRHEGSGVISNVFLIDYGEACKDHICFFGGTPRFWSPEHIIKPGFIQPIGTLEKYDVWALGLTLFLTANGGLYPYPERDYYIHDLEAPDNSLTTTISMNSEDSEDFTNIHSDTDTGGDTGTDSDDDIDFPMDTEFDEEYKKLDNSVLTKQLLHLQLNNVLKANDVEFEEIKEFFELDNTPRSSSSDDPSVNSIIDLALLTNKENRPSAQSLLKYFKDLLQNQT